MSVEMPNKNIPNNGVKKAGTSCEGLSALFGNSMEITSFHGFSCESSSEYDIDINYNNKK